MKNRDFTAAAAWTVPGAAKVLVQVFCMLIAAFFLAACGGSSSSAPVPVPVQVDPSSDSAATGIVLSNVELDQFFQSTLFSYTATVSLLVPTTRVMVNPSHANATITVNGIAVEAGTASDKVTLDQGVSTIDVVITAEDGINTTTYTFDVTRRTAESLAQRAYIKRWSGLNINCHYPEDLGGNFGAAVALSSDTLAIGDFDSLLGSWIYSRGGVHLFQRDASDVWSEQDYIHGTSDDGEGFGESVTLDGDTLAIGAPLTYTPDCSMDPSLCTDMDGYGRVIVYARDANGVWNSRWSLLGLDGNDHFGESVALDGDTLAVGARGEDAVHVFTRDSSGAWSQQFRIPGRGGPSFGEYLALDGDTLAVGTPGEDSGATGIDGDQADTSVRDSGAVFVFTRDARGAWSQQAYIKALDPKPFDGLGRAIALDDDTLAVGAHEGGRDGAVYVFIRDASGLWSQQAYIKASNAEWNDHFGMSVALDGDALTVGSEFEDSGATGIDGDQSDNSAENAGAVYVFTRDANNVWSQQAYIKASNTDPGDFFGYSVALESGTLAVGAPGEESSATGVGGDQSDNTGCGYGAVYVFN